MDRPAHALYYTTVIGLSNQDAVLGGFLYGEGHEPSITRVPMIHDGQWFHLYDLDDIVHATALIPGQGDCPATLCFLGRRGLLREHPRGGSPFDSQLCSKAGYFLGLRSIAGSLYACGTQGQLLRRQDDTWVDHDQGLFRPLSGQVDRMLRALDGFADDDLYAVGMGGQISHWDGSRWQALHSPTGWMLNDVCCAPDRQVYIGGVAGTLLRGSASRGWQAIEGAGPADSIESLAWFDGKLYAAAQNRLFCWDGVALTAVSPGVSGSQAFFRLHACEQALWSVGDDCVLSFDGNVWTRHEPPA